MCLSYCCFLIYIYIYICVKTLSQCTCLCSTKKAFVNACYMVETNLSAYFIPAPQIELLRCSYKNSQEKKKMCMIYLAIVRVTPNNICGKVRFRPTIVSNPCIGWVNPPQLTR